MRKKLLDNGRELHTYSDVLNNFGYFMDIGGSMEIGLGWMNCVYDCLESISALHPKDFVITTISEEKGLLFIGYSYIYTGKEKELEFINKVNKYIDIAKETSSVTCESCGNKGILRDKDWRRVTCNDCENYLYDIDVDVD